MERIWPANTPQWLKDANISDDAVFEITIRFGIEWVIWKSGYFRGGEFRGGEFRGGEFRGGYFMGGYFMGGEFMGGEFRGGYFMGGYFRGGEFRGGEFRGGEFMGGEFRGGLMCVSSKWYCGFTPDGKIKIGCKIDTIAGWDKWFKGKEEFSTSRKDPQFKRIYAHYRAIREFKLTLDKK